MGKLSKAKKNELLSGLRARATGEWDVEVGRFYLVLHFLQGESGRTEKCPFCGQHHFHGFEEGHRRPHCSWNIFNQEIRDRTLSFKNSQGQVFCLDDGYTLRRNDDNNP